MERALRILQLNSFAPPRGGAERHVATVARLLADRGHEVETWAPGEASGLRALRDRVHNPDVAAHVTARISAFRPDVIHVHNFLRRLSSAPFAVARREGVPTVLTVHDFQLFCPRTWAVRANGSPCERPVLARCLLGGCRGGLDGMAGRFVYAANTLRVRRAAAVVRRCATAITAPSASLAGRLAGALERQVAHLPYPFPPTAPFAAPRGRDLLFVGRTSREKGLDVLLAALAEVPSLRLTIAGDGPALAACRALAQRLPLGDRVRFLGWVDEAGLPALFERHGAVVAPSLWMENSPMTVHEAMAAGRPVLGSVRGGIPELVAHGEQGLLFEPMRPGALVDALRAYAAWTDAEHAAMARRAHERAAAFGDEQFTPRLLQQYRDAIAVAATATATPTAASAAWTGGRA